MSAPRRTVVGSVLVLLLAVGGFAVLRSRSAPTPPPSAAATSGDRLLREHVAQLVQGLEADATVADLNAAERTYAEVRRDVLEPWRKAFVARDAAAFGRVLATAGASPAWGHVERSVRREHEGVRELAWQPAVAQADLASTAAYLGAFERVDAFRLSTFKLEEAGEGRVLDVRFDLRGTVDGARRNDRGHLKLSVAKSEGRWVATNIALGDFESIEAVAGREPTFADATVATGFDKVPVVDRREALRRGGYAIAAADYDNDNRPDVLVGNWGPMALYRNTGSGFVDVTRETGLEAETLVKSAAFADLDNDGHRDIVLLRFVENENDPDGDFIAYRNRGDGTFEKKANLLTRTREYDRSMPLALGDFDGNGYLDVYIGFPGARDFTNDLAREERNKAPQGVWLNDGSWAFREMAADGSDMTASDQKVFPHAALVTDLNGDHKPDVVVIDDSGRISPLYRNEGDGRFQEVTTQAGFDLAGWAMGVSAGDYDGDGHIDLVTTLIDFEDVHRLAAMGDAVKNETVRAELAEVRAKGKSQQLFRNNGDGTFTEVGAQAGIHWPGEAPAGVEFIDYNNDGHLDIYVMNGLWSGGEEEFTGTFLRALYGKHAREALGEVTAMGHDGLMQVRAIHSTFARMSGPNAVLAILRDFKGSLEDPFATDATKPTLSMAGDMHNRLYRNNGDGTFTEVSYVEGADRLEDGYMAATADIDGDGRQDLVLRNADPAPGRSFPTVTLLRNQGARGKSLALFLQGDKSNRDGIGAHVTAYVGNRRLVREVRSVAGAVQGEPAAFIGLGSAERADKVEIRWPSGVVQVFENVPAGRVSLREGAKLERLASR